MIEERFLISAVNIRRKYLNVSSSLDIYHKKAKDTLNSLDTTMKKIDELKDSVSLANSGKGPKLTEQDALAKLLRIIQDVEDEGKSIERLTEPINREIEKLALEEQELYQQIKITHPKLSDEQIVESVRQRLLSEGLS
jgi:hypothetical protein